MPSERRNEVDDDDDAALGRDEAAGEAAMFAELYGNVGVVVGGTAERELVLHVGKLVRGSGGELLDGGDARGQGWLCHNDAPGESVPTEAMGDKRARAAIRPARHHHPSQHHPPRPHGESGDDGSAKRGNVLISLLGMRPQLSDCHAHTPLSLPSNK